MSRVRLTAARVRDFTCPADAKQRFLWDTEAPGLAVRATPPTARNPSGLRAFVFQGKLKSRDVRITIGDTRTWDIGEAQAEARRLRMALDQGNDPRLDKAQRLERATAQPTPRSQTFGAAVEEYVRLKRRAKDNLPLKERTRRDYLGMVAAPKEFADGRSGVAGNLYELAEKPVDEISADDIRRVHDGLIQRGTRQAAYAMQVLRAVLNWHGVQVASNPFSREVAGRHRINIPQARGDGRPIPAEHIGVWWQAVQSVESQVSRDYFMFLTLTGMRVSEPKMVLVSDCDVGASRVVIRDTKNRSNHRVLLSRQAAEIVQRNIAGKEPGAHLFTLADGKKARRKIIERSGVDFRAKDLRATFASIAAGLVTAYTLKAMMNHAGTGDVTGTHYVQLSDADLRSGWQAVADFIDRRAAESAGEIAGMYNVFGVGNGN